MSPRLLLALASLPFLLGCDSSPSPAPPPTPPTMVDASGADGWLEPSPPGLAEPGGSSEVPSEGLGSADSGAPSPPAEMVQCMADVRYQEGGAADPSSHSLDVYWEDGGWDRPVIVFVHGGGWKAGDKRSHAQKGRFFVENGYVFVSVNYRLTPEVQHPGHAQDVAAAFAWVAANIRNFGGDRRRVVAMGHSAGAHLAALVSTRSSYLEAHGFRPDQLAGVVLLDGAGYDIPWQAEINPRQFRRTYLPVFGEDPATWAEASPTLAVKDEGSSLPHLVIHVPRRAGQLQSQAYAWTLEEAGAPVTLWESTTDTHSSLNKSLGAPGAPANEVVLEFLAGL